MATFHVATGLLTEERSYTLIVASISTQGFQSVTVVENATLVSRKNTIMEATGGVLAGPTEGVYGRYETRPRPQSNLIY